MAKFPSNIPTQYPHCNCERAGRFYLVVGCLVVSNLSPTIPIGATP